MLSIINIFDYDHFVHIDQRPVYRIDFDNSKYSSYKYSNNEHVFTVEQGTQFNLRLHLTANPMPTYDTLYRNSQEVPESSNGVIYTGVDYMRIDSVTPSQSGYYRLSSSNFMGEGSISFRLNVEGRA